MNLDSEDLSAPFRIRIGMFDERLGPICLNASKGRWCDFVQNECGGLTTPEIVDAMAINKNNIGFEEENWYYQVINIQIANPKARGRQNRFTIIIKYDKKLGKIKEKYIAEIRKDFYTRFGRKNENSETNLEIRNNNFLKPNLDQIREFTYKWENRFSNLVDITDILEKEAEISKFKINKTKSMGYYRPNYVLNRNQRMILVIMIGALVLGVTITGIIFGYEPDTSDYSIITIVVLIAIIFVAAVFMKTYVQRKKTMDNEEFNENMQNNNRETKIRLIMTFILLFTTLFSLLINIFNNS